MSSSGRFFNEFADQFDTFYDGKRSTFMQHVDWQFRRDSFLRFSMTFHSLGDLSGKRVLDIGCGSGPYIVEALKRGAAHVCGIDPAPRMLSLAKQRVSQIDMLERISLIEGYFPETQPTRNHDCAIIMGVMDYVSEPTNFLRSLSAAISERAVISFPSTHWFRTPFRKIRYKLRRCPVFFYNRAKIENIMQQAGVKRYDLIKIPGAGMDYVVCVTA